MIIYSGYSKKNINLKLFKNGSIQMSGCKSIIDCENILTILNKNLNKTFALMENNTITDKPFYMKVENLNSDNLLIYDFKIILINSNFKVNYSIKREQLYKILLKQKISCRYQPCIHACVNIKFKDNIDEIKPVSIFVFQSGNVIITGAKEPDRINNAYNYINTILNENLNEIQRKDIDLLFN